MAALTAHRPAQIQAQVLATRRVGAYLVLTLVAPGVAEHARPGQFVALAVGGPDTGLTLRRCFAVYTTRQRGVYGATLEIVLAVRGRGTEWLAARRGHDVVDLVGPLGRPFTLPRDPCTVLLVGGGYGSAPLFALAELLRERGCRVDFALGAASADRLFGKLDAKRISGSLLVTTDDGSDGDVGYVTDRLTAFMLRAGTEVVYACGPMPMLAEVARQAGELGLASQVAVEESMACGIGVCMTCVLPVVGDDGQTRMVRSCVDGPVFRGERVRFADIGRIPPDVLGAPTEPPVGTEPP